MSALESTFTLSQLLGEKLTTGDGSISTSELDGKVIGLYFSAHWCPPCKAFTPTLISSYNAAKEAGSNFEVVFVSRDHDDEGFQEYFGMMSERAGWKAVPFDENDEATEEKRCEVRDAFDVKGIPTLTILKPTNKNEQGVYVYKFVTNDGKNMISKEKEAAIAAWCKSDGDAFSTEEDF